MNALLQAAIAWRGADAVAASLLDAIQTGDWDFIEYQWITAAHERAIVDLVLPAKSALHLAIEQAEPEACIVAELLRACHVALDALGCDRVRQERLRAQEIIHAAIKQAEGEEKRNG